MDWPRFDSSHTAFRVDTVSPFCVVTAYTPDNPLWKKLGELTSKTKVDYCQRHGYGFRAYTSGFEKSRPPSWSKLLFVKDALRDYEWVFWMDADAAITGDRRLEELATGDFVVSRWNRQLDSEEGFNLGVFLTRRGKFADWLLDEMWSRKDRIYHWLWEQSAFHDLWMEGKLKDMIRILDARIMNSVNPLVPVIPGGGWQPGDFVLHIAGKSANERIHLFEYYLSFHPEEVVFLTVRQLISEILGKSSPSSGALLGACQDIIALFLSGLDGKMMLVDTWKHIPGYRDTSNRSNEQLEKEYHEICRVVEGKNVKVFRGGSSEAALTVEDGSLDWVFVDGTHSYSAVMGDIESWWPKIRDRGILCGHDYLDNVNHPAAAFEVKRAVDDFARRMGLPVRASGDAFPSWAILKKNG